MLLRFKVSNYRSILEPVELVTNAMKACVPAAGGILGILQGLKVREDHVGGTRGIASPNA